MLTLPEAKKRINYMIQASGNTLASLERLKSLQLRISPSVDTSTPKELQYEAPFLPLTNDGVKAEHAALKQQPSQFAQLYLTVGAQLRLNTEAFSALWKRATPPDTQQLEKYVIQTVYFRGGTEQPFAAVREQNEDIQDVKPDSPSLP